MYNNLYLEQNGVILTIKKNYARRERCFLSDIGEK
jgi:hypothetical protein